MSKDVPPCKPASEWLAEVGACSEGSVWEIFVPDANTYSLEVRKYSKAAALAWLTAHIHWQCSVRLQSTLMPAASGEVLRRIAPAPSAISATLDARGATYGSFADNSRVAIGMLKVMEAGFATRKEPLADHEKNALIMIIEKMSRIITGKPHEDNWIDLGGYAELGRKPR